MSKNTKSIGERIRHFRLLNEKSQKDLAAQLFVSDKVVSKWEMGRSIPDIDILLDLSDLFHVSIEYLLTGEENKPKTKGAQVVYNENGTINKYIGEDGDRLFTRSEVTIILKKRYARYHEKYLLDLKVKNDDELKSIVTTYRAMKDIFLNEYDISAESRFPLCKVVRELQEKGATDDYIIKCLEGLVADGCAKGNEIEVAKTYLTRKNIW